MHTFLNHLQKESKNLEIKNFQNEETLLKKISELEIRNNLLLFKISEKENENQKLLDQIENLHKNKNEFEKKANLILVKEEFEIESLRSDFKLSKIKIKDLEEDLIKLQRENEKVYSNLLNMELEKEKISQEAKVQLEKSKFFANQLKQRLDINESSNQDIHLNLKEKKLELTSLAIQNQDFYKKYSLVTQLNKSIRTNMRLLKNKNKALIASNEGIQEKLNKKKDAFESVAIELSSGKTNNEKLQEIIGRFFNVKIKHFQKQYDANPWQKVNDSENIINSLKELEGDLTKNCIESVEETNVESIDLVLDTTEDIHFQMPTLSSSENIKQSSDLETSIQKIRGINELFNKSTKRSKPVQTVNKIQIKNEISDKIDSMINTLSKKCFKKAVNNKKIKFFPLPNRDNSIEKNSLNFTSLRSFVLKKK